MNRFRRITAEISADALRKNYRIIRERVPQMKIIPMLKADAYGHGAVWAAQVLHQSFLDDGLYGVGLASLEEGAEIRNSVGEFRCEILVFSGAVPWTQEKGDFCQRYGLSPILADYHDWRLFLDQGWDKKLPYHLEFNTGMNRLGLPMEVAPKVMKESSPTTVMSHLALGEDPHHRTSKIQMKNILKLKELCGSIPFHFANSAATWNKSAWKVEALSQMVRPGISLYGVPPWSRAKPHGLEAVLNLHAEVAMVQNLNKGDAVGYGSIYRAKKKETVAVCSAGYADGILRILSRGGFARLNGKVVPFKGTVSMDLVTVGAFPKTQAGDRVYFLGEGIDPWKQSNAARTIPYELLTSLTDRVERIYV